MNRRDVPKVTMLSAANCVSNTAGANITSENSLAGSGSASIRKDPKKLPKQKMVLVGVGSRRAWEQDVFVPRQFGIYQPVGDSVMLGGVSRAMRMIPPMVDIAKDVERLCPEARFINYSNPMPMILDGGVSDYRTAEKLTEALLKGQAQYLPHFA
jgi:hypothetical protein